MYRHEVSQEARHRLIINVCFTRASSQHGTHGALRERSKVMERVSNKTTCSMFSNPALPIICSMYIQRLEI